LEFILLQMKRKKPRHFPIADDPIPAEAIRLSHAFKELLERAKQRSEIFLPEGALDSALVTIEAFGNDPDGIWLSENETIEIRVRAYSDLVLVMTYQAMCATQDSIAF
jgi:gluconate kinase